MTMRRSTLLIDETGTAYDLNGWAIREKLGVNASGKTLADYVVRNCGFIELSLNGANCSLRLAPGRTNYLSFAAAGTLIEESQPERISLNWYDGEWHHEIVADPQAAFEKVFASMWANRAAFDSRFRSVLRNTSELPGSNPLKSVFSLWQANGGNIDIVANKDLLDKQLRGKYAYVMRPRGSAKLSYASVGSGIEAYQDQTWYTKQHTVADQPDYYYGRFLVESYREAMIAREPTLLDVDGVVADPLSAKPVTAKYTRLALPLITDDGYDALFCASVPDRNIDLW
ncbi:MAG: hypothetical protein AAF346_12045 [Pseudomonadota bacterium]